MIPSASCVQIRRDGLTASHPKWRPKTKSVLQKPNSWTSQSPGGPQPHHTILLYSTMNDLLIIHESTASGQNPLTWYQEASASWPVLISLIPPAASLPRPSWPTRCSLIVHERFWFDALAHSVCLAKIAISFYLHILLISPYLWHCSSLVSLFVDHSNYMWHSCLRAPVYFFVSTAHLAW